MLRVVDMWRTLIVTALCLWLSGCVTKPPLEPEEAVRRRAQAWLDAVMAFDVDAMYSFTPPAYRSAHSAKFYAKNYAGRSMWTAAELGSINCLPTEVPAVCKVEIVVSFQGFGMRETMETSLTNSWVEIDRNWYIQPR